MEKKDIKHTPTPWKVDDYVMSGEKYRVFSPADPVAVASVAGKANAEFIVRAVNSHDELVEAIKNAIDSLPDHVGPRIAQVKKELSEALAKAEGEA